MQFYSVLVPVVAFTVLGFLSIQFVTSIRLEPQSFRQLQSSKLIRTLGLPLAATVTSVAARAATVHADQSCNCDPPCFCGAPSSLYLSSEDTDSKDTFYDPSNERIYDTLHQSFVPAHPEKYLSADLNGKKVITIGEIHSNPCHHKMQFEIVRSLASDIPPDDMAIGLECFYRQHQGALDRFIFRHNDFTILKQETNWDETWGYDINYYAKMFSFAAKNKIRLVGLNLPYAVARLVSEVGIEQLPAQLKRVLPDVDLTVERHRQRFLTNIGASDHSASMESSQVDRMYQTQTLWDEYMSESAANYMAKYPDSTLVVIAGLGHVQGRVAIPDRIYRRTRAEPFVIIPQPVNWSKSNGLPIVNAPLPRSEADWIWYTQGEFRQA
mmetsp:Transcript_19954/g.33388  ORF Transcript_19954/g.33388 Transcript_19954/m.33388 type:complete len:382 (-) Transcript_19954:558-1703(-)